MTIGLKKVALIGGFILICLGNTFFSPSYLPSKKIAVSIDSLFILRQGPYDDISLDSKTNTIQLEKEITDYVDSIIQQKAQTHGFILLSNYQVHNGTKPDYILSGYFGKIKAATGFFKDSIEYYIHGNIMDCFSKRKGMAFEAAIKNDQGKKDAYIFHSKSFKNGIYLAIRNSELNTSFIPINKMLHPMNFDSANMSFSIDTFIKYDSDKKDRDGQNVADLLTNILNNILVFNQPNYPNGMNFPAQFNYNYYPNYLNNKTDYKKARYNISGVLSLENDSTYRLNFYFSGRNLNLIAPDKIKTEIMLNRNRIIRYHNYGEILTKLHQIFPQVIFQQRLF